MRQMGISANIVTYSSLACPFAHRGAWEEVERFEEEMASENIATNEYFLYTLLLAYSRAKPRQRVRAEVAFARYIFAGVKINDRVLEVLTSCVGRARCAELAGISRAAAAAMVVAYTPITRAPAVGTRSRQQQ